MKAIVTQKEINLLNSIKPNTSMVKMIKKAGCTYAHGIKLIDKFEEMKLLKKLPKGRMSNLELTDKGIRVKEILNVLKNELL